MRRSVTVPVLAALLAGCGVEDGGGRVAFTQVEVQAYLEREAARTLPGLAVEAASCPSDLPDGVGEVANCSVAVEGTTLHYEVQRLVAGRFEARPRHPIVLVDDIATAVRSKLEAPAAEVECGGAPIVQPSPGQPLTCRITGSGEPRTASVQVGPGGTITVTDT